MAEEAGHYPYQAGIDAYGNGGFRFAGMSHKGSILCTPRGMDAWAVNAPSELTLESLKPVLNAANDIDVLFIGMGSDIAAVDPAIRKALKEARIIVEAVSTGSAVRTYNILLGEKRAVAAALIAVENAR
jgi:uncharacterized protein